MYRRTYIRSVLAPDIDFELLKYLYSLKSLKPIIFLRTNELNETYNLNVFFFFYWEPLRKTPGGLFLPKSHPQMSTLTSLQIMPDEPNWRNFDINL